MTRRMKKQTKKCQIYLKKNIYMYGDMHQFNIIFLFKMGFYVSC